MYFFLTCPSVHSDELSDLRQKVNQLEEKNRLLQDELKKHEIPLPQEEDVQEIPPQERSQEKSLATMVGLKPPKGPFVKGGFIDFNYYYDDREFNVLTVNLLANLPLDIQYFQLLDLAGTADSTSRVTDLSSYYTEVHLWRPVAKNQKWLGPLDWSFEYINGTTSKDLARLGTRIRLADVPGPLGDFLKKTLKIWYNIDFHWYESDGKGYEIEHVYGGSYFDGLITVGGFADNDFDDNGQNTFVTEHQIGLRIVNNLYYVTEFKYNYFRAKGDRWGTAYGLEYKIPF